MWQDHTLLDDWGEGGKCAREMLNSVLSDFLPPRKENIAFGTEQRYLGEKQFYSARGFVILSSQGL